MIKVTSYKDFAKEKQRLISAYINPDHIIMINSYGEDASITEILLGVGMIYVKENINEIMEKMKGARSIDKWIDKCDEIDKKEKEE